MDGTLAIERNRQALAHIVATLAAMAGLSDYRTTLPRRLRNTILRILRPAESATRRLVIAMSRGLAVTLPPLRQRRPLPSAKPSPTFATRLAPGRIFTGIVLPLGMPQGSIPSLRPIEPSGIAAQPPHGEPVEPEPAEQEPVEPPHPEPVEGRTPSLPLLDRLRHPFARREKYVPAHLGPRISIPGVTERRPLPPEPSPHDLLDARRLRQRLDALAAALSDLPGQAQRFARWQARKARASTTPTGAAVPAASPRARRQKFRSPLRFGRPIVPRRSRRHEVHDILAHAHDLAIWALDHSDTS